MTDAPRLCVCDFDRCVGHPLMPGSCNAPATHVRFVGGAAIVLCPLCADEHAQAGATVLRVPR